MGYRIVQCKDLQGTDPLIHAINRKRFIDELSNKSLTFGCRIITGKDRRLFKKETQRQKDPQLQIREQGKIIKHQIGTIIKNNEGKLYCVSDNNDAPWVSHVDLIEKVIGHPIDITCIVRNFLAMPDARKMQYIQQILALWEALGFPAKETLNSIIDRYTVDEKSKKFCDALFYHLYR